MAKLKSLYGSAMAICFIIAGALVALQVIGWLGGMLIWPAVWCLSCVGCVGDVCPKSSGQEMLARFAIGSVIMGILVVKMSLSQRKKTAMMKRLISVLVVLALLVPAAAWAGEDRAFSKAQETEIRKIICDLYPNGIIIAMDDIGLGETRIICWAKYSEDYFLFTASANGKLKLDEIFPGSAYRIGIKMEEKIAQVLRPLAE